MGRIARATSPCCRCCRRWSPAAWSAARSRSTQAIAEAGWSALVASAGGRLVPAVEHAGGRHITPAAGQPEPDDASGATPRVWRRDPRRTRGIVHARSRAPAWSALAGLPANRRAFRHHLPRHLRRGPAVQAALQFGDGERRAGHRRQPLHRRPDRAAARDRSGAHPGHSARRGPGAVRSGAVAGDRLARLAQAWRLPDGAPSCCCPGG